MDKKQGNKMNNKKQIELMLEEIEKEFMDETNELSKFFIEDEDDYLPKSPVTDFYDLYGMSRSDFY